MKPFTLKSIPYPTKRISILLPMIAGTVIALLPPARAFCREEPPSAALSAREAVRLALANSPALEAARRRLDAANAALRGAGAPYVTRVEVAPGVGFANGNALLSRQIDLGGTRTAERRRSAGERDAALAEVTAIHTQVTLEARSALVDLARARANEATARETEELASQVFAVVRRRVEIGEAPTVQATRAEIEVDRARQETIRARTEAETRRAALNRLIGQSREQPVTLAEGLGLPEALDHPLDAMIAGAVERRADFAAARGRLAARRGEVDVARSLLKPTLFAEVASDFWSLDREPFRGRDLGVQARLSFPLGRDRAGRAEVEQSLALAAEGEAELEGLRRTVALEIERAAASLSAAREVASNYQNQLLPRTRELHRATRAGFETGLVSFLEVLETQRVLRQTQTEAQNALFEAVRARLALDAALGLLAGPASPSSDPIPQP